MLKQGLCVLTFFSSAAFAIDNTAPRPPSYQLMKKGGQTAALSNGGVASVRDISAVDSNPAGIALGKEVSVSSEMQWQNDKSLSVDVGVMDAVMSEVAAGLKARQTTMATGGVDRRFSLAFAEQIEGTPFALGVGGDYIQIANPNSTSPLSESKETVASKVTKGENVRMRIGGIYSITPSVQLGLTSDGYFDRYSSERDTTLGGAVGYAGVYIFNADVAFTQEGIKQYTGGMTLLAKEYMELYSSYGYEPEHIKAAVVENPSRHRMGLGVAVKSSKFRLFYAASKILAKDNDIEHYIGASLTLTM